MVGAKLVKIEYRYIRHAQKLVINVYRYNQKVIF